MDDHEAIVDCLRKKDWKDLAAELIYILSVIETDLERIDDNLDVIATDVRKVVLKR